MLIGICAMYPVPIVTISRAIIPIGVTDHVLFFDLLFLIFLDSRLRYGHIEFLFMSDYMISKPVVTRAG